MVHYEQIVSRLCRQLGRFVEVVEEIENYNIKNRYFLSKISLHFVMLLSSIWATKRRNWTRTRRGIKDLPHHALPHECTLARSFRAACWRCVANTTKQQALPCFFLQFELLGNAICQVLALQWLKEQVLLCHQKSHRCRSFWRVFGLPAILAISVHPTYIRTREFSSKRNFTRNVGTHFRCKPWTKFR